MGTLAVEEHTAARPLRQRDDAFWRRFGAAAALTAVLPVSLGASGGLYLWDLLPVSDPVTALRLLAPLILGAALVALSYAPRLSRLGQSAIALAVLAVCAAWFTASTVAFREAFDGLLAFVGRRPLLLTGGLSLLAAGAELRSPSDPGHQGVLGRKVARVLLLAGVALVLVVYLLPQRGEPFGLLLLDRMVATARYGGARLVAGRVLFWLLGLLPLGLAVGALAAELRRWRPTIFLPLAARYGLPLLAALLCFRLLLAEADAHGMLLQIRTAVLLAVAIAVSSRAIEAMARHLVEDPLPPLPPASRLARDARLRQLVRAYLGQAPADRQSLLAAPGVAPSHRWLQWLMGRRLEEIAADLPTAPADLLRPDEEAARRILAALESRLEPAPELEASAPGEEGDEQTEAPPTEPQPLGLWLATGKRRLPVALAGGLLVLVLGLGWRLHRAQPDLSWSLGTSSSVADELFGTQLPRFVVALAQRSQREAEHRGAAEAAHLLRQQSTDLLSTARQVDPSLAESIEQLIRTADALDRTGLLWLDAVHAVNRQIRALGLPYYLDGNALRITSRSEGRSHTLFYVTSHRVEAVRPFEDAGRSYAALHVRRLDRLNISGSRLGTVRPDEPFALVMVDAIDRTVADRIASLGEQDSCGLLAWGEAAQVDEHCAQALVYLLKQRGLDPADAAERTTELIVAQQIDGTERHEIQHQVDTEDLVIPPEIYRLAPWAEERSLHRVAHELSAYLAELSSGDDLAITWRLADLTGFLIRRRAPTAYRYAAAIIVGELLQRPVIASDGHVDLAAVAALWRKIADHPGEAAAWVEPAARQAHDDLFGFEVAALPPFAAPGSDGS